MLKIKINKRQVFEFKQENNQVFLNNELYEYDINKISDTEFHLLKNNKSYRIEVISLDKAAKTIKLKINGETIEAEIKNKLDELLEKLGMNKTSAAAVQDIKAPMPGLVIELKVEEGQEIKAGDPLIILEAMKMENIIKSPREGVIKSILVKKGQSVEKNQILIKF